jgi:hypothetical protein
MKEDRLWIDIGPEKTALLRGYGFDIDHFGDRFLKRGKNEPWIVAFEHVSDTQLSTLRAELSTGAKLYDRSYDLDQD